MPNISKVDKKQPKKSKEVTEASSIPEKKVKKSKTPKDEAPRAEEEKSSSKKKENVSSEKKERREKAAGGEESALESGGLVHGPKKSSGPAEKGQNPEELIFKPLKSASGPVKRRSAAETSKNASGPSRSSKPVSAYKADVPKQKKRTRDNDESMASTSTITKKFKLNDGGAAAASSKVKDSSIRGGKCSSKEEEEIMLEDSSDEEVEGEDYIHGFSTDEDSSDDEGRTVDVPALDVSQLPAVAKDEVTVQKRLQQAKSKPVSTLRFDCSAAYPCPHRHWIVVYFT